MSYERKHNLANGERNRDGADWNESRNWGIEGPTADPQVLELRERAMRGMMATLAFSLGVPMLNQGDELGRTQQGNNNPWCQDSALELAVVDVLAGIRARCSPSPAACSRCGGGTRCSAASSSCRTTSRPGGRALAGPFRPAVMTEADWHDRGRNVARSAAAERDASAEGTAGAGDVRLLLVLNGGAPGCAAATAGRASGA